MKKQIPTPIILLGLVVLLAIAVAVVLALGPCVLTSNPIEPSAPAPTEPSGADETGATTP